jgi:hypothetical protein
MLTTPGTITAMAGTITGITIITMATRKRPAHSRGVAWVGQRCW